MEPSGTPANSREIIPHASYVIYEGASKTGIGSGVPGTSRQVTFYTSNGEPIKTEPFEMCCFSAVERKLDPSAPKPQPTTYKIKFWPAFHLGLVTSIFGLTKGSPGDFIVFHDKNGNIIDSHRYNKESDKVTVFTENKTRHYCLSDVLTTDNDFPLDLSIAQEVKEEKVRAPKNKPWCPIQ
jgi:hypothetical protein